ncbi:uncharacterized protein L969DRAFT_90354 [Mixia osmundae IAM 14324]|uniref:Non-specific serine/threonine protein kinase n=1 Tax=Mixia osmundae (strain CBS 9802 / IAM 14324 / JCM 22182 / KY 12970) TaxID=764103 RepID=G7E288_MIXOS|nr:uncharacterized protein L969DRAFT_90354 [Mixia osmundae IAM 14324]KEI36821.1 hypothetical protein L969DRAFT_90354 [Mixia osmundae IAM 14324]GAA96948.1 hypothetical protein E5Q_03622 [Mixia osmundae IAM 14324]
MAPASPTGPATRTRHGQTRASAASASSAHSGEASGGASTTNMAAATGDRASTSRSPSVSLPASGSVGLAGSLPPSSLSGGRDEQTYAARLSDPSLPTSVKLNLASEIRDRIDLYQRDSEYIHFLDHLLPVILAILKEGKVTFNTNTNEQRLRHVLIETLHRIPHSGKHKDHAMEMMVVALQLVRTDNEDNACLCMKILIDLHRSYKDILAPTVDQFLSTVKEIYAGMTDAVPRVFGTNPDGTGGEAVPDVLPSNASKDLVASHPNIIPTGMTSFKLLTECPIAIVFLFQTYRDVVSREIEVFVPLIFQFLSLQPAPQAYAHEQAKLAGDLHIGIAANMQRKRARFQDLLVAQVKTMSFLAYVLRVADKTLEPYRDRIPEIAIRLLKDCPPDASSNRKELLVATRHILSTAFRSAFVNYIDVVLDERVLVGAGVTPHETLRPLAYSMLADLIHHVRMELSIGQLSRVVQAYSCSLHDPTLAPAIQTMCSKLLLNLIESILKKDREEATKLLSCMFEAFVRKVEGMAEVRKEWTRWARPKTAKKAEGEEVDEIDIERRRPIAPMIVMTDPQPDPVKDARFLFRNLIFGVKTILTALKHLGSPLPDADQMGRLFTGCIQCLSIFDTRREAGREAKDVTDGFCAIFLITDLIIFQEVIDKRMAFFLDELLQNHELLAIPQAFLSNEAVSQAFVGISFRFLVARLDEIGSADKEKTSVMLRLFKMSFMAITIFPDVNEIVLQPLLGHIIMQSLKLASKAPEPTNYYFLLRALFRSIGGGRFELLYKEVLPLLQALLENLNGLLNAAERSKRDLFVELCLTVPVRLSVLLPYLSFLMKPLVLALQAGPELVSQGLRTLELCVDNLTQEFLNPLMAPVINDVMAALWKLLRPVPFNHQHAHTTVRILGKIGGRNRRNLGPVKLEWRPVGPEATIPVHFDGQLQTIRLAPVVDLALRMIRRGDIHYRRNSYMLFKHAVVIFLKETLPYGENEDTFGNTVRGLFESARVDEFREEATEFLMRLAEYIFALELRREPIDGSIGRHVLPLSSAMIDAMAESLASAESEYLRETAAHVQRIVEGLIAFRDSADPPKPAFVHAILRQLAARLSSLCYDQSWQRKTGGATGIAILTSKMQLGLNWMLDHELEFVRALLFTLKDMPSDPPGNVGEVSQTLLHILGTCNAPPSAQIEAGPDPSKSADAMQVDKPNSAKLAADSAPAETPKKNPALAQQSKVQKHNFLIGMLIIELSSQVETVRETAKASLEILSKSTGKTVTEMLRPVRERLLGPIFSKPLRALAFSMQIGHIDAVSYCITLRPPLIDLEENKDRPEASMETPLLRLLTEALGIADAEDSALTGRATQHKNAALLTTLRVACVKLLSAAMATPEFLSPKYNATRMKTLGIYFKLLYVRSPDVVNAAYWGLKQVLNQQGKLPKDLLQGGLRPVLTNLSDHKRLTVPGLQGLARLLELLTSYFKKEIGQKLLDHFRALAEPNAMTTAALAPQNEHGELQIMAAIINIFHLLPYPVSVDFLQDVSTLVADVELHLRKATASVFTEPLARYLNLYPAESTAFYFARMSEQRFMSSFRFVMASGHVDALAERINEQHMELFSPAFRAESLDLSTLHAALLIKLFCEHDASWIVSRPGIVELLIGRWQSPQRAERLGAQGISHMSQLAEDAAFLDIFLIYLRQAEHIDLLFRMLDVYTWRCPSDRFALTRFYYETIAKSTDIAFRTRILSRFLDIFADKTMPQSQKTAALRVIINPMLYVAFSRGNSEAGLVDAVIINRLHATIWQPGLEHPGGSPGGPEEALLIELLHMSTLIVRHRYSSIAENKKDVIKYGWKQITVEDITVKQSAYALIAQFLAVYESPARIVLVIWNHLLRAHQLEGRALVREALDVLAPALPFRSNPEEDPPGWIACTRRVLAEEGHSSVPQLSHIYNLFARHCDLFFPYRGLFVPNMVSSLSKLAFGPLSTVETRVLTVDVIDMLLQWERRRLGKSVRPEGAEMESLKTPTSDTSVPKRGRAGSVAASSAGLASGNSNAYSIPLPNRDTIISTLIRLVAFASEPISRGGVAARAMNLLKEFLGGGIWDDVSPKLAWFSRTLTNAEINEQTLNTLCNTIDVLCVVQSFRPDAWVLDNLGTMIKIIEKVTSASEVRLHVSLRPILERTFEILPQRDSKGEDEKMTMADAITDEDDDVVRFTKWATMTINDGLRSLSNIQGTIVILQAWVKHKPEVTDEFLGPLIRVLTRMTKEHFATANTPAFEGTSRILMSTLEILRRRVSHLGEQRRWLLSALVQIVEKSPSTEVCRFVLEMMSVWIKERKEAYPTVREKAGILSKMMTFENRHDDALLKDFLQLILDIYTDPALARTELTVRLEQAFLLGCRNRDATIRTRFLEVFDRCIDRSLFSRLYYILGVQNWESIGETNWIHQALDLLLGAVDAKRKLFAGLAPSPVPNQAFVDALAEYEVGGLVNAARRLLYADATTTHVMWISTFKAAWPCITRREQTDMTRFIISLLGKEWHTKNRDRRPNVIQTILSSAQACSPPVALPPHLVRYLGKSFNAWHVALEIMQDVVEDPREDDVVRDCTCDALAELYSDLSEYDNFYGLWRRRSYYNETNAAISFEQHGLWQQAQVQYEAAQVKARSGAMPFTESEYNVWEDHWVLCAQKLQQWDILTDLAKHEGNADLFLECAWRLSDWQSDRDFIEQSIDNMESQATPRRRTFEAYMALVKVQAGIVTPGEEKKTDAQRLCDEGIQLALRKWYYLPDIVSEAHLPLLHVFQQFVELQEASLMFNSLSQTTAQNLEAKSAEIKGTLQTWRERLPNLWDDVNIWSDLVAWRQHVFSAINKAYLPLIPALTSANGGGSAANSHAYRGYHETAWIINRFAHVARKHHLHEVCITSLTKIYTLPNIEIQEAFLKLREQARCHYQSPTELNQGLEVINNTNLMYFGPAQKAEFFTLKGMFLARLNLHEEAAQVFNQAVGTDMSFPKAWAEWGEYHDRMFKDNPNDLNMAANAVSCYLQAAGLYKNARARKILVRILWLLSLDDNSGTVAKAFDLYKGDVPVWYWITFIPQLLSSLSYREARYARIILMKIAKTYPQALFYLLRTTNEDLSAVKRQQMAAKAREAAKKDEEAKISAAAAATNGTGTESGPIPDASKATTPAPALPVQAAAGIPTSVPPGVVPNQPIAPRQPWEHVEEIMSILKTAFPLLTLTMEMIGDQIQQRFKPTPEEDIFRLVSALLNDALQQFIARAAFVDDDGALPQPTVQNVARFAENLHPGPLKTNFERDFLASKPNLQSYVARLQRWRDRYEVVLDRKAKRHNLEVCSHWLVEFQYQKFDEIEVPGQYLKYEDSNMNFVRIGHFQSKFDVSRLSGICTRRLTIVGHDSSLHSFAIQLPAARHSRREERIMQLFRMLNSPLTRRKESRKRNALFTVPIAVPLAPHVRLLENDASIVSLQDIYENFCHERGIGKDDPIIHYAEKLRRLAQAHAAVSRSTPQRLNTAATKLEAYEEVRTKMFPDTVLKNYMARSMVSASDLWHLRKRMTQQLASFIFMTYVFSMGSRLPSRILFSRVNGGLHTSDMLPTLSPQAPEFANNEAVPFRFTPSIQKFITAVGTEGLLTSSLMAIAGALTEEEDDLEHRLCIFVREEVIAWHHMQHKTLQDKLVRAATVSNVKNIVRRAQLLSCKIDRENQPLGVVPANQTILELLSYSANPQRLSAMDPIWLPWL